MVTGGVDGRRGRGFSVVAAGAALVWGLGGCALASDDEHPSPIAEEIFDGEGHFDLTGPPSREEAGMPPGRTTVTYERSDPFSVRVSLPGGDELTLDARTVGFDSYGSPDPETGAPTTLDIHVHPETLDAGRDHLLTAADELGLDEHAVTEWYQRATSPRPELATSTIRSRWMSTDIGYLVLQVRGSYSPRIGSRDSAQVVVHYSLAWGG